MAKLRRFFCALAAHAALAAGAFAQSAPGSPPALTREDLEAWLDAFAPIALQQGDIAGLVVAVVKDGQVLLEKGYGLADVRGKVPANAGTVMRVASLSKAFTATAVMQLVEQGKIDLDKDINEYLDFRIPPAFDKPVTMRNLLSHTSGFEETSYKHYRPPLSLHDHVAMVPDRVFPPGRFPAYSNYGLNLAGYIVQRVSGESIDDYIERHLLQPLGMEHSAFRLTLPDSLRALEAKSYALASTGEPYNPELIAEMMPAEAPASGLATTAHDMTRFMLAHLGQGTPILAPTTLALMHESLFLPMPGTQPIALGLFRNDYNGRKAIGHSGDGEGQHADMKVLPELGVGLFFAVNSDGAVPAGLPAGMGLRQQLFEAFMDRYFPTPPAAEEPTASTAAEHAKLVAGEYVWSRQQQGDYQEALGLITRYLGLTLSVTANPDGSIVTSPFITLAQDGKPRTWREVGPFVWRQVDGKARLIAKVENGKVIAVLSDAMPSSWVNLKVPTLRSAGTERSVARRELHHDAAGDARVADRSPASSQKRGHGGQADLATTDAARLPSGCDLRTGVVRRAGPGLGLAGGLGVEDPGHPTHRVALCRRSRGGTLERRTGAGRGAQGAGAVTRRGAPLPYLVLLRLPPDLRSYQLSQGAVFAEKVISISIVPICRVFELYEVTPVHL
jgi:CubicO group peptidase (beta-lactamase class C family)